MRTCPAALAAPRSVTLWTAALFCVVLLPAAKSPQVQVEIFESVPADPERMLRVGAELATGGGPELSLRSAGDRAPAERYTEPAFGFARIPTKYSLNALPLDRSAPFVLRASHTRSLNPGEYQFRLRAKGRAWFLVDGKTLLETKAQKPNTSGDDPVPPPVVRDNSPLRPAPYPHQEVTATVRLEGEHSFTLVAVIGGKGLAPSPGELSVSFGRPGEVPRLLSGADGPLLTDAEWEAYAAQSVERHRAADVARRRAVSAPVVAAWENRHEQVRQFLKDVPAEKVPAVAAATPSVTLRAAAGMPVFNDIDNFIGARLKRAGIAPTAPVSDLEFLRRVSLDTIGMIPTPAEITAFLQQPPAERRRRAVERLLADPSWADHWVSYWQDVLAENPGILKPDLNNTGPFRWWLHQSFTDNIPFDRLVAELVEMEGGAAQGAPAGFGQATLNDAPMAAKADILSQAFLGQKLECARCHDAPFHPFKQKELFSFAAMLSGKPVKLPATSTVPLVEGGRRPAVQITLKPGDTIAPEWPFEKLVHDAVTARAPSYGSVPTRHQLAALLVSPKNERFAEVIVNRMWKRYMGVGLVEPVDDWNGAKPSHPELLRHLAREFMMSGYDLKHVARLILSSHTYQRRPIPLSAGQAAGTFGERERLFAGPLRRRMSAEQLVDSLHRSVGKSFQSEDLNLNPAGDRPLSQFLNMGRPSRAWELTALSNERDRPALALPGAQSLADVLTTYGWRQSRQNPLTNRDDAPSPMQTLILANGTLGTRIVRLADDSIFTELALEDLPLEELVREVFLRVLSRPPSVTESRLFMAHLRTAYPARKVPGAQARAVSRKSDDRVSWSNHLSAEATLIRLEEERRLRLGDEPTARLTPQFRERFEDALWALVNSPEFVLIP